MILLHEPGHQPSPPTFTFLNLLPFPLESLPGTWIFDVTPPTAPSMMTPQQIFPDTPAAQEYHNNGDDFWSGVDSESSSTHSKEAADHVNEDDADDQYWAQYDDIEETGDSDGVVGPAIGGTRGLNNTELTKGSEGHRSAHPSPGQDPSAAPETRGLPLQWDIHSHDPVNAPNAEVAIDETRRFLRQAWARTTEIIPSSIPVSLDARRSLVFTLLAELIRDEQ
ncbi:hypothetical protein CF327_g7081 [Tilletia walkeri]|nr:hypothetical protein CF327_g7081 [Tilletia walkeri]